MPMSVPGRGSGGSYAPLSRPRCSPEPGPQPRDVRFVPVPGQDEQRLPVTPQAAGVLPGADLLPVPGQQPRNEQDEFPGHVESDTIGDHAESPGRRTFFGETPSTGSSAPYRRCPLVSACLPAWALCAV